MYRITIHFLEFGRSSGSVSRKCISTAQLMNVRGQILAEMDKQSFFRAHFANGWELEEGLVEILIPVPIVKGIEIVEIVEKDTEH